jgi:hypothetical protein
MRKYFIILIVLCPLIIFSYPKEYSSDFNIYDQVAYGLSRDLTTEERTQIKGLLKKERKTGGPLDFMDTMGVANFFIIQHKNDGMYQAIQTMQKDNERHRDPKYIEMSEAIKRGDYYARDYDDLVNHNRVTKEEFNDLNAGVPNPESPWVGIISLFRVGLPLFMVLGFPIILVVVIVIIWKVIGASSKAAYKLGDYISKGGK